MVCRFKPRRKLELDSAAWRRVLHHVTVEVLTLAQAGRDVNAVYTERAVKKEDWQRTSRVQIKQKDGAIELQFPTNENIDMILKAMPQSLAEEIVKAAENAEAKSEEGAEPTASEVAQQEVDAKQIDAEEKSTLRMIKALANSTNSGVDKEWLDVSIADPVIKLAVSQNLRDGVFIGDTND